MRMRILLLGCVLLFIAPFARAQDPQKTNAPEHRIHDIHFVDLDGKKSSLHDIKGKKAIVVVFLSFDCPVCNSYLAELSDLARTSKDVGVLGVCVSSDEPAHLAGQARKFQVGFPIAHDPKLRIADAFEAATTPEAFVLDSQLVVRYRGCIDDAYAARLKKNKEVTRRDLRQAVDQVLAGQAVASPVTKAVGCAITRGPERKVTTGVTFFKDVLPILQNRCQVCHRPGETGPFSLQTYEQAVRWSADIKEYTQSRQMPPWKPKAGLPFHGERKLTDSEIATLAAWADGGDPRGESRDAPPPPRFGDGWLLGQPDLILSPREEFTLGPTGGDLFRCFVFPIDLPEDKFVTAYEVRPGARQAVHHTVHFLDVKGRGRAFEKRTQERRSDADRDFGPGYSSIMGPGFFPPSGDVGGWAPGISPLHLPDGVGFYLPKQADFVAHVHYHRTGKIEKDKIQIGLYFSKKAVNKPLQTLPIGGLFLSVPPGEERYRVKGTIWMAQDCTLHTVTPHMHLLGKSIKITMTPPGAKAATTLIEVDPWDFAWQEIYVLKEPVKVKAGTRFDVEGTFDNSAKNPNNPNNPPRRVFVGESTTNEMCFGFVGATIDEPGSLGFRLWPNGMVLHRLGVLPKR